MSSNQKMIAGAAGAAVLVAAAFMAGRHQSAPQAPDAPAAVSAADEARAAKTAANDAVTPKNGQRAGNGDSGGYADNGSNKAVAQDEARICATCATVLSVRSENREGKGSGIGAVGGAVVGGLLGNQLGGGTGKKVATVGGAVAGGFAGNEIEKRTRSTTVWVVKMRNADQSLRTMEFSHDPAVQNGDVVKVNNGQLVRQ
ncbi:glycine zipper 2TM domain-containing protein [Roseateles sp. YR242]|uniref:glycine zipper 2TM domain-containing protein n=1 Tax=Roseateles sp. YR242 TaxID=1855305 RepID=UPI0015A52611|nr:glycine zipper 2TM domain-containing protein [Roseateles sp. YR242]